MTGFSSPPESPPSGTPPTQYGYYGGASTAPPAYAPPPPRYPAPSPPRRRAARKLRWPVLILALIAVVGLLLIGVSYLILADARQAEITADNTCEFAPPQNPPTNGEGEDGGECGGFRGANIEDQTSAAYENTSATSNTLFAVGLTLALASGGIGTMLMVLRRMDRIESGHNPPE